jgi:hypothetical protein
MSCFSKMPVETAHKTGSPKKPGPAEIKGREA